MNDILARLKPLVLELQELPDWPAAELPAGLILYDVLVALGTPQAELEEILGREWLTLLEGSTPQDAKHTPSIQFC